MADFSYLNQEKAVSVSGNQSVPSVKRTEILQTAPQLTMPTSGTAAVWENVARVTGQMSDQFQKEAALAETKYLAGLENDITAKAVEFRDKYNHNPQGFDAAWEEYMAGTLSAVPGRSQEAARIALDETRTRVKDTLLGERRSRDRSLATDTINNRYGAVKNEILAESRLNGASPKLEMLYAKADSILQSAVNLELRSSESASFELDDLRDLSKAEAILGGGERIYETQGIEAATKALDGIRDPTLNLSPEQRDSIYNRGASLLNARYSKDQALITKANSEMTANLDLMIGTAAIDEDPAALDQLYSDTERAGYLSPDQRTDRLLKIQKAQADIAGNAGNNALVYAQLGGAAVLDPTDPKHQKAANSVFNKDIAPSLAELSPQEAEAQTLGFIQKTNIVPDAVKNQMVGGLLAGAPETQVMMAGQIGQIIDAAPFTASAFNEQTIGRARHIQALTVGGMADPAEVVRRVQESERLTPEVKKIRNEEAKAQKHPEKNKSFLSRQSDVLGPFNIAVPVEMKAEFDAMQNEYFTSNGNLEASQKAAWDNVSKVWGVSDVGMGGKRWMKYAPEKIVPNGDAGWIEKQLLDDVKVIRPDKEYGKKAVSLQYDDETRNAVGRGEAPGYQIWVMEDGLMNPLMSQDGQLMRFYPDYRVSDKHLKQVEDQNQMIRRDTEKLKQNNADMRRFIEMEQNAD